MTCTQFPHCLDGGPCCLREALADEAMERARRFTEEEQDQ